MNLDGSDVFIIPGSPVVTKAHGSFIPISPERLMPDTAEQLVNEAYRIAGRDRSYLNDQGDDDFSFGMKDLARIRCNAYKQRGSVAATCRVVAFGLPDPGSLHIPEKVLQLSDLRTGMVIVTGPAGSGKSTTLACIIDRINKSRSGHIVTIEDPIEYLHPHKLSLVSQREVPSDASSFARALRGALRQAPDVIMLGEMRDTETIATAITAAETGHLMLSSLHTVGAAKTIDRIIDAFDAAQQSQIRIQLSMVLQAVISQRLVLTKDNRQIPVFEVMNVNPAIRNLIREGKTHQIDNAIYTGGDKMLSMDVQLAGLVNNGMITVEQARLYAIHPETIERLIKTGSL